MREISHTNKFKKDLSREMRGKYKKTLQQRLEAVLELLIDDEPLPADYDDHSLSGEWKEFRDCHVFPDLVLIYQKPDDENLILVRIGSHSKLSL